MEDKTNFQQMRVVKEILLALGMKIVNQKAKFFKDDSDYADTLKVFEKFAYRVTIKEIENSQEHIIDALKNAENRKSLRKVAELLWSHVIEMKHRIETGFLNYEEMYAYVSKIKENEKEKYTINNMLSDNFDSYTTYTTIPIVQQLLRDSWRDTNLLFIAVREGNENLTRKLLEDEKYKGYINTPTVEGETPLYIAELKKYERIIDLLRNKGAVMFSVEYYKQEINEILDIYAWENIEQKNPVINTIIQRVLLVLNKNERIKFSNDFATVCDKDILFQGLASAYNDDTLKTTTVKKAFEKYGLDLNSFLPSSGRSVASC